MRALPPRGLRRGEGCFLRHSIRTISINVDHWQVMTRAGLYHASCLACSHCARPLDPSSLLDTKEAVFCKPCYAVLRGTRYRVSIYNYLIIYNIYTGRAPSRGPRRTPASSPRPMTTRMRAAAATARCSGPSAWPRRWAASTRSASSARGASAVCCRAPRPRARWAGRRCAARVTPALAPSPGRRARTWRGGWCTPGDVLLSTALRNVTPKIYPGPSRTPT